MLEKTQNNKIKPVKHPLMRTKATKFGNLFSSEPKVNNDINDIKNTLDRLFYTQSAVRPEPEQITPKINNETDKYIVEDPNEIKVTISKLQNVSPDKKLPFFKSIMLKLANF